MSSAYIPYNTHSWPFDKFREIVTESEVNNLDTAKLSRYLILYYLQSLITYLLLNNTYHYILRFQIPMHDFKRVQKKSANHDLLSYFCSIVLF